MHYIDLFLWQYKGGWNLYRWIHYIIDILVLDWSKKSFVFIYVISKIVWRQ